MPEAAARRLFTVNQLAEELGMTARALRFYEAKGLITPARAGANRVYDHRDRARLLLILRGKRLGFSLAKIRQFLDLYAADRGQVSQIRMLLDMTQQRIAELQQQRRDLELTLTELHDVERQAREALAARGVAEPTMAAAD